MTLRLLADENIPLESVRMLRRAGHDIVSIAERSPGIADEEVVRTARAGGRVVVTFDRDYGELVFRHGLPAPTGVLYLRFLPRGPRDVATYISRLIENGIDLEGRFTTADHGRVRQAVLGRPSRDNPV